MPVNNMFFVSALYIGITVSLSWRLCRLLSEKNMTMATFTFGTLCMLKRSLKALNNPERTAFCLFTNLRVTMLQGNLENLNNRQLIRVCWCLLQLLYSGSLKTVFLVDKGISEPYTTVCIPLYFLENGPVFHRLLYQLIDIRAGQNWLYKIPLL